MIKNSSVVVDELLIFVKFLIKAMFLIDEFGKYL